MNAAQICVPVCVGRAGELEAAVGRAAALGEAVELRFDCLGASELRPALELLGRLLEGHERTFVITFRPAEQGGGRALDAEERAHFWAEVRAMMEDWRREGRSSATHFVDVEFDGPASDRIAEGFRGLCRVIRSHHDFRGVPADLEALCGRMWEAGADVSKLAVTAADATDCVAVLRLAESAREDGPALVALAMGEAGVVTRLLGPSRGAPLAYGALDEAARTAPGQVGARDLRELYRVREHGALTAVHGLVGSPVAHTLSPHMHNAAFAALALDAVYVPFEVRDLGGFFRRMVRPSTREVSWNLRGLSVTAPHKSAVVEHLDRVEPRAREVGAVNTVVVEDDGGLSGYNTDAAGALAPLGRALVVRGARVAVIGAGGAARAVLWGLREGGAEACVFAREPARAREAAERFGARAAALDGARFAEFDAVVNATPLGTRGERERETPASASQLRGARLAYDLVYNPAETPFLREARAAGCQTLGGLPMLAAQAAEQFRLWTGRDAPADLMLRAASAALSDTDSTASRSERVRDT